MKKAEVKWDNVLSPYEMRAIFKVVRPYIDDGTEIFINSDYFAQQLLKHSHEGLSSRIIIRHIPYVYRRIIEEAKNEERPSILDVVLERRLENSSSNH
jgi:hypothetical protein